jgi:hypothetical protein
MKPSLPAWMKVGKVGAAAEPSDGLTVTMTLELETPRQVIGFAWDMAREVTVFKWWHRPAVVFGLLIFGFGRITTRSA